MGTRVGTIVEGDDPVFMSTPGVVVCSGITWSLGCSTIAISDSDSDSFTESVCIASSFGSWGGGGGGVAQPMYSHQDVEEGRDGTVVGLGSESMADVGMESVSLVRPSNVGVFNVMVFADSATTESTDSSDDTTSFGTCSIGDGGGSTGNAGGGGCSGSSSGSVSGSGSGLGGDWDWDWDWDGDWDWDWDCGGSGFCRD